MMLSTKQLTVEQWMHCIRNGITLTSSLGTNDGRHAASSDTSYSPIMPVGTLTRDTQGDIAEMWRQAVQGDAAARHTLLGRIMPASAMETQAVVALDLPRVRLEPAGVLA